MTVAPDISIIIPAYNCARFLPATLDSILAQTISAWECIVVDDGSTDDTVACAQSYAERDPRFRLFCQPNSGPSRARNHGFRHSDPATQYVTFMDSDDVWLPDALATLQRELERDPQRIGAHGLADFINAEGEPVEIGRHADFGRGRMRTDKGRYVRCSLERPTTFAMLSQGNVCFPPGLVLARRASYEQAGIYDEAFGGAEDWDMLVRLSRYGDFTFVNRVILQYRRHDTNLGAQSGIADAAWRVRCKAFFSPENTLEQQRLVREGWRAYQQYMIGARLEMATASFKARQYRHFAGMLARIPVHVYRRLLGHPTLPRPRKAGPRAKERDSV